MRQEGAGVSRKMARKRINKRKVKAAERLNHVSKWLTTNVRHWLPRLALALVGLAIPYVAYEGYFHLVSGPTFAIKTVEISGNSRVSEAQILEVAGFETTMNIFDVDLPTVQTKISDLPWVKEASAERELPDVIRVSVVEHVPALVLVDEGYVLVNREGVPFKEIEADDGISELLELPILTGLTRAELTTRQGQGLFAEAVSALEAYDAQGLSKRVALSEVHVDPVVGISLVTVEGGTEIRVGTGRLKERMERLDVVLQALERESEKADYILVDHESDLARVTVGRRGWASKEASSERR